MKITGITSLQQSARAAALATHQKSAKGFTLVEVMVSLVLFVLLAVSALTAITQFHSHAKRQSTYNTVLALVIAEQEAIRTESYVPPNSPFTNSTTTTTKTIDASLAASGSEHLVTVLLSTTIEPVASGHLVTISADYTLGGRTATISSATLINNYSTTGS